MDVHCSDTLTSDELINFVRENNILTWGGNVRETEGYQGTYYPIWNDNITR